MSSVVTMASQQLPMTMQRIFLHISEHLSTSDVCRWLSLKRGSYPEIDKEKFEKDILDFFHHMTKRDVYTRENIDTLFGDLLVLKLEKLHREVQSMANSLPPTVTTVTKKFSQISTEERLTLEMPRRDVLPASSLHRTDVHARSTRQRHVNSSENIPPFAQIGSTCSPIATVVPHSTIKRGHGQARANYVIERIQEEPLLQHPEGENSMHSEESLMSGFNTLRGETTFQEPVVHHPQGESSIPSEGGLMSTFHFLQSGADFQQHAPQKVGERYGFTVNTSSHLHAVNSQNPKHDSQKVQPPVQDGGEISLGVPEEFHLSPSPMQPVAHGGGNLCDMSSTAILSLVTESSCTLAEVEQILQHSSPPPQKKAISDHPVGSTYKTPQDQKDSGNHHQSPERGPITVSGKSPQGDQQSKRIQTSRIDIQQTVNEQDWQEIPFPSDVLPDGISDRDLFDDVLSNQDSCRPSVTEKEPAEPLSTGQTKVGKSKKGKEIDDEEKEICEEREQIMEIEQQDSEKKLQITELDVMNVEVPEENVEFPEKSAVCSEMDFDKFDASKKEGKWPALAVAKRLSEERKLKEKEEAAVEYDETTGIEKKLFAKMQTNPQALTGKERDLIQKQMMQHLQKKAEGPKNDEKPEIEFDPDKKLEDYQRELAAPGLMGFNYIICAPVRTGKVLTAAAVCNHQRKDALAKKDTKPYKALFVTGNPAIKDRHVKTFMEVFPPGMVAVLENTSKFREIFEQPSISVLMVTADRVGIALRERELSFTEVNTIVIEDCHLVTTRHSYNEITKYYLAEKKQVLATKAPRGAWTIGRPYGGIAYVIGLTANLGSDMSHFSRDTIVAQCGLLDSKGIRRVETVGNLESLLHINKPPETDTMLLSQPFHSTGNRAFRSVVEKMMSSLEERYFTTSGKEVKQSPSPPPKGSEEYTNWIQAECSEANMYLDADRYVPAKYLLTLNTALIVTGDLRPKEALAFLKTSEQELKKDERFSGPTGRNCQRVLAEQRPELQRLSQEFPPGLTPMLRCLIQQLVKIYDAKPHAVGLVLVRSGSITTDLAQIVNNNNITMSKGIKAVTLLEPCPNGGERREAEVASNHIAVSKDLRERNANLVISTDFEQPSLDLPTCDFVIRYNLVTDGMGVVQATGRAKSMWGQCFLVAEKDSRVAVREQEKRNGLEALEAKLKGLNEMDPKKWYDIVEDKQLACIRENAQKEFMLNFQRFSRRSQDYTLLCGKCHTFICNAHYLLKRGTHVSCTDSSIKERLSIASLVTPIRGSENDTTGVLKCTGRKEDHQCNNKLGLAVDFRRQTVEEGYSLDASAFYFSYLEGLHEDYTGNCFATWEEVDFFIQTDDQGRRTSGLMGVGGDDDDDDDDISRGGGDDERKKKSSLSASETNARGVNQSGSREGRGKRGDDEKDDDQMEKGTKKRRSNPKNKPDDGDVDR